MFALDTRGHGRSSRGKKKLDFDTLAEDVYLFMQKMNLRAAYIVGFSDGANIALTLALHHPACVERLMLVGEKDLITTHHNRRLVRMIPNVIYREIKGANHFSAQSHAGEYNRCIAEFLLGNYNHRRREREKII